MRGINSKFPALRQAKKLAFFPSKYSYFLTPNSLVIF